MLTLEVVTCLRLRGHLSAEVHSCPQPQFNGLIEVLGELVTAGYAGRGWLCQERASPVFSNLIWKRRGGPEPKDKGPPPQAPPFSSFKE